jgi:translation initiation factor IF-3
VQKFVEDIGEEAVVTQEARVSGNQLTLLLAPNKTKP